MSNSQRTWRRGVGGNKKKSPYLIKIRGFLITLSGKRLNAAQSSAHHDQNADNRQKAHRLLQSENDSTVTTILLVFFRGTDWRGFTERFFYDSIA